MVFIKRPNKSIRDLGESEIANWNKSQSIKTLNATGPENLSNPKFVAPKDNNGP